MKNYIPSNGTEGVIFMEKFCDNCINQHPDSNDPRQCYDVLLRSQLDKFVDEWIYDKDGEATCTAFVKWDWGNDEDGWNEPPPPEPIDPNQLLLPYAMNELFPLFFNEEVVVTRTAIFES